MGNHELSDFIVSNMQCTYILYTAAAIEVFQKYLTNSFAQV